MAITFRDVEEFIRDHNVFPHQVFSLSNLKEDREFGSLFTDSSALEEENKKLKEDIVKEKEEKEKVLKDTKLATAKDRFTESLPKDLTDKQKTFIIGRFKPEIVADLDDDKVKDYIEEEKKQFADTAKLFGVADNSSSGTTDTKNVEDEGDSSPEEEALKLVGVG